MKTIFSLLFFMFCIPLFAQDESQCRKLVELTKMGNHFPTIEAKVGNELLH